MSYDLTAVLTTIAAASASIVAILGGFIASKLIAISGDRSAALDRLKQINEEMDFHVSERDKIQAENDEDDALDFIRDHVSELLDGVELDQVYSAVDHPNIIIDVLRPYWDRACGLKAQYWTNVKGDIDLNDDFIPKRLVQTVKDDDFGYEVLRVIGGKYRKDIEAELQEEENRRNPFSIPTMKLSDYVVDIPAVFNTGHAYQKNCEAIQEHNSAISLLELQKKQCGEQIQALKKPRGMKSGLAIFALFTVFCIILPLAFSPYATNNYQAFMIVKAVFLGLFSAGLLAIFCYMVYLLKWTQ